MTIKNSFEGVTNGLTVQGNMILKLPRISLNYPWFPRIEGHAKKLQAMTGYPSQYSSIEGTLGLGLFYVKFSC